MVNKLINWGKTLERHRQLLGLSQFELAEITGLSDLTIRNIEKGKDTVALKNWLKVNDALGFDFEMNVKRISDEARKSV
jgi:transcriptional regulator with XRE-family HTH domain